MGPYSGAGIPRDALHRRRAPGLQVREGYRGMIYLAPALVMFSLMTWLYAFAAMLAVDFVFGQYTAQIIKKDAIKASFLSFWIVLLNALVVVGYTEDHWLVIPTA